LTQKITDKPLGKCPTCKGKVKKLISNTSFQLKGTGWYITDYARKGQNGETKGGSASKSSDETKSDTKTETKKTEAATSSVEKSSTTTSTASA